MFSASRGLFILCFTGIIFADESKKSQKKEDRKNISLHDVVFVVITQENSYNLQRAKAFKEHFYDQLKDIPKESQPALYLTHETWKIPGAWTMLALLPRFAKKFKQFSWVFVCEDETRVDLMKLLSVLKRYDHTKEYFLGKALRDQSPTIIHHFAFIENPSKFAYPDTGAGIVMSNPLFMRGGSAWENSDSSEHGFSIDPKHELAKFIYQDGQGVSLTEVPELCTYEDKETCATTYPIKFPDCGEEISEDDLFIGVKTCEKFHKDRVVFVKKTWGKDAKHLEYYSEKDDPSIPTITFGIPNTERGHCGKTMAMLKRWQNNPKLSKFPWYLIADDDSIINLQRLRKLLSCYNPSEPIHLGEIYGYQVAKKDWGYTYITGGGGMIFSREAVRRMNAEGMTTCSSDESPDDMTLGMRFKSMEVPLVHSPYFHQARPEDYSEEFLKARTPLSFHKHWNTDPLVVYKNLVKGNKAEVRHQKNDSHEEL